MIILTFVPFNSQSVVLVALCWMVVCCIRTDDDIWMLSTYISKGLFGSRIKERLNSVEIILFNFWRVHRRRFRPRWGTLQDKQDMTVLVVGAGSALHQAPGTAAFWLIIEFAINHLFGERIRSIRWSGWLTEEADGFSGDGWGIRWGINNSRRT